MVQLGKQTQQYSQKDAANPRTINRKNPRKNERRTETKMEHSTKGSGCNGCRRLKHGQMDRHDEKRTML